MTFIKARRGDARSQLHDRRDRSSAPRTSLDRRAGAGRSRRAHRAFTLLELVGVLAIIGVLSALAVPAFQRLVSRARATEARAMLEAIAHAERVFARDHGGYVACAPSPSEVPSGVAATFNDAAAGWRALGFQALGPVRYQYSVELAGPTGFVVVARGDLDGDGVQSELRLDGATLAFAVNEEYE